MNHFLLVVAALFSVACAAQLDWRIVGGSKASDGQFPYQVSMRLYGSHSCGGSILNERWVLTAAHCVLGNNAEDMTVVVGTNKLNSGGDTYQVARAIGHVGFDMHGLHDDIALLQLSSDIIFGAKAQPIPLETGDVGVGVDLVLSGWGRTSYPGDIPDDLQFIQLKSIGWIECALRHTDLAGHTVTQQQLCTLTKLGEGACQGDSGGPLVHQGKLAGVVSWGKPCARDYPDVFTRVSSYIDWINTNMV